MKVTPILRTYVLATHRLLYHAQTKNAYTILDCTGAKDSEINQTILKAVEYYRTVQGSLVNVIRRTGQESPALHGFPSLKFNIVMRHVTQYRLAFNHSVGHTTLQICKIIYLVMIKNIPNYQQVIRHGDSDGEPDGKPDGEPDGEPDEEPDGEPDGEPDEEPDEEPDGEPDGEPS